MIPMLYESGPVKVGDFIGHLNETISCTVPEELNGAYDLELTYPASGILADRIRPYTVIGVNDGKVDTQYFDVYNVNVDDGLMKVSAHHMWYRLSGRPVRPMPSQYGSLPAYTSAKEFCEGGNGKNGVGTKLIGGAMGQAWYFYADDDLPGSFITDNVMTCKEVVLKAAEVFGADLDINNNVIWMMKNRGQDKSGSTIRWGDNVKKIDIDLETDDKYNGVVCYWSKPVDTGIYFNMPANLAFTKKYRGRNYPYLKTADLSREYKDTLTEAQLTTLSNNRSLSEADSWYPSIEAEAYPSVATNGIVRTGDIHLGDVYTIVHGDAGVSEVAKVIKTTYDVLAERYTSCTIGTLKQDLATTIANLSK